MNSELDYERLYEDVSPSVVSIYVGQRGPGVGSGSGFVYDAEHVVTNSHVVGPATEVEIRFSDGQWRLGTVVGTDVYTDLAAVRVDDLPADAAPLPVASESPRPGRRVAALGNPLGLDGSITAGIVSGSNRSMPTSNGFAIPDVVQTDAPINPGNSGGPLVALREPPAAHEAPETPEDADGERRTDERRDGERAPDPDPEHPVYEVVGVNRARQGDNIGFAVSPAIVSRVVPALISEGRYRHSYLRARTLDVTPTIAEANGLDEPRGVLVVDVRAGPAGGDVLRGSTHARTVRGREIPVGGDVIVGINGQELHSHEELMGFLITETRPGEPVEIDVIRDSRPRTLRVVLGERPAPDGQRPAPDGRGRQPGGRGGGDRIPID
ncbi:S1C family serine protease [Halegenticoccus soli]|uniref:S1C family serine protease n=1 Tax=Halegenticoccus soli TaxID=1985678 RepID=UPI000C6D4E2F|nr:trypsin-like peptidase domain-containing protein [Halegenticoccus soli]